MTRVVETKPLDKSAGQAPPIPGCRTRLRARHVADRAAKDGLLALSVAVGLGVLSEVLEEEVETQGRSTSKSAVSRTLVERTRQALAELMSRQLSDLRLAVMLDGIELKKRMAQHGGTGFESR